MDVATLTDLLREAEEHHGHYEATAPKHHWSGWYAAYISAREQGRTPEEASDDAALDRVGELEGEDWTRDGTVERVRRLYEFRQRRFKIRAGKIEDEDGLEEGSLAYQRMMHEVYAAQRAALVELRNSRAISADVMRRIEHELDLEETRLEV